MSDRENLRKSLEELIRKSILVTTPVLHEYIPPYMGTKYENYFSNYEGYLMNPHLYTDKPISQRLFENLLTEMRNQIEELEEFESCIKIINASNAIKNSNKSTEIWRSITSDNMNYLMQTIWKVIKSSYEKGAFDEIEFAKEYSKLESFFYSGKTPLIQILIPVYNLRFEQIYFDFSHFIEIPGRLVLRSITDDDKKFIILVIGGYSSSGVIPIHRAEFMFELQYYEKFYSEGEYLYDKIRIQVDELITALRLLKDEYIGTSLILSRHPLIDKTILLQPIDYDVFKLIPRVKDGEFLPLNQYLLSVEEIGTLQIILELLRKISNKSKDLAIRHFNSAYEKNRIDDKFLDLMITYEALFSAPEGDSDSVTHKLALRFSKLLGKNAGDAKYLYGRMKKMYGIRSTVVHGGIVTLEYETVEQLLSYMRKSLVCYLYDMRNNSFETHKRFIEYLDFEKPTEEPCRTEMNKNP